MNRLSKTLGTLAMLSLPACTVLAEAAEPPMGMPPQPVIPTSFIRAHKQDLVTLKNHQYDAYSYVRAKYRELQTVHQNIHEMLTPERKEKTKTTDKNQSL